MTRRHLSPGRLGWLTAELRAWQAEGLLTPEAAESIRGRYGSARRLSISVLVLTLGACFVGAGLIWLVAANLDQLSPGLRFGLIAFLWLGLTVGAETASRRLLRSDSGALLGALRLLAVAAFGATVFQAAQSLQVPAYEPRLLGAWGLGTLAYAYAVRGLGPLTAGILVTTVWTVWQIMDAGGGRLAFVVAVLSAAAAAAAIAVAHGRLGWAPASGPWRMLSTGMVLIGLFAAAVPEWSDSAWSFAMILAVSVAAVLLLTAAVAGPRSRRLHIAVTAAALAGGIALTWWTPMPGPQSEPTAAGYVHAALAVLLYLAVTSGYAVLGAFDGDAALVAVATAALVVFVTFQAFAVFAPILSGAALFLLVGTVLLVSGILAERARRRLTRRAADRPGRAHSPGGDSTASPPDGTGPDADGER